METFDLPAKSTAIPSDHRNNFGFLRLLLAVLVMVSHSPEMLDGDRSREILTRIFGTVSFGELAVDGFFLISGYLVTQSLTRSRSYAEYLIKRILRVYPGFIAAYLFSLVIVGLLAGGTMAELESQLRLWQFAHLIILVPPSLAGAFVTTPNRELNGSMWTLAYEFRCYLLLIVLSVLGVISRRKIFLAATAILCLACVLEVNVSVTPRLATLLGDGDSDLRLCTAFCCGSCFFLFGDKIVYTGRICLMCVAALLPLMFMSRFAQPALFIFGGYILFWFAFNVRNEALNRIGSRNDLSYGLYLYAWPVQNLLVLYDRHLSPWLLFSISIVVAGVLAYGSWVLIERPFLGLKSRLAPAPPQPA